jgi:hypothetical protein
MKMPSLLALNADHRAICGFFVGGPVQRHPDRETRGCVVPNNLDAGNGRTARPLPNRLDALFPERCVAQSDCLESRHCCPGRELNDVNQVDVRAHHTAEPKQSRERREVAYDPRKLILAHGVTMRLRRFRATKNDRRSLEVRRQRPSMSDLAQQFGRGRSVNPA